MGTGGRARLEDRILRVAAVVPFKRFTQAKSRLRTRYADAEVEALGRAMLGDVLAALCSAAGLERVLVLTDDDAVAALASEEGASVRLRRPDPGLNPTIEAASAELAREGFDAVLVALGDLPLLQPKDVEAVIEAGREHPVVLVPSSDGGTALLFRRPPDRIPARFGGGSGARHSDAARDRGLEAVTPQALGEAARLDLDTPEDARRLLASDVPCRTRRVLESLRQEGDGK